MQATSVQHISFANICELPSGIIRWEFNEPIDYDMDKLMQVNTAIHEMLQGEQRPHLIIMCPGVNVDKEVRDFGTTKESAANTTSNAIVCDSLAHRILGNFFIRVQRPAVPTRMFKKEEEAIEWLEQFL